MRYQRKVKSIVRQRASRMRRSPTPTEAVLWQRLRLKRAGGFRFRQQAVIFGFIADFYCPKCKLVVEIDGGYHAETTDYDRMREDKFASVGIKTLRFSNEQIEANASLAVAEIVSVCSQRI